MEHKIRTSCILAMRNYADEDAWLSDVSQSYIWGDASDAEIPAERIAELRDLWQCCHDVKHLRLKTGLTQAAFSARYSVSLRAVQFWESGGRTPPPYTLPSLASLVLSDLD